MQWKLLRVHKLTEIVQCLDANSPESVSTDDRPAQALIHEDRNRPRLEQKNRGYPRTRDVPVLAEKGGVTPVFLISAGCSLRAETTRARARSLSLSLDRCLSLFLSLSLSLALSL